MYANLVEALQTFLVGPDNIFYMLAKGVQDWIFDGQGISSLLTAVDTFFDILGDDIQNFFTLPW